MCETSWPADSYVAQSSCCVCLSLCFHRQITMLNLHRDADSLYLSYSSQYETFSPVPKPIQFRNCEVSTNTKLLNCSKYWSCLLWRTVCVVCDLLNSSGTAKHRPSAEDYWRRWEVQRAGCLVSSAVLVLMRSVCGDMMLGGKYVSCS
jgi:hypothetical protein